MDGTISPYDVLTGVGTNTNPLADDDPNDIATQLAAKYNQLQLSPNAIPTTGSKVAGFIQGLASHLSRLGNNGEGRGGGGGSRMSAADLLFKRQEAAQKQADWEQTYGLKQQEGQQKATESADRLKTQQAARDDLAKQRDFNQSRAAVEDYANDKTVPAPLPNMFTGEETDTGGNTKSLGFMNPSAFSPDTEGRPSYTAGGATMIPRSLQETTDAVQKQKQNEFNARLADVNKTDPTFAAKHQDEIAAWQLFGKLPTEKQGDFMGDLLHNALTNPDPTARKAAEDTYRAGVNMKKGLEPEEDIPMRNPSLKPWEKDWSVIAKEPNKIKSLVQSITDRDAAPGNFSMKDPDWKRAIELTKQVDPSFNLTNYKIQQDTKNDYASKFRSRQTQSFRTVIDHVSDLENSSQKLNNFNTQWENAAYQATKPKLPGGYPELDKANIDVNAVAAEMANTVKGANAAATDPEINNWRRNYDLTKPPAGLHAGNQAAVDLMLARAAASQRNWEDVMGRPMDAPIFPRYYADKIDKIMDSPGYTERWMNGHSAFGDNNVSIDSKGSITGPSVPPPSSSTGTKGVTFRDKATGALDYNF